MYVYQYTDPQVKPGWAASPDHLNRLNAANDVSPSYPACHQRDMPVPNERG